MVLISKILNTSYQSTRTLIICVWHSYQKYLAQILIIDNKNTAGINYKEQYKCELDPMILTNYIIATNILKFFIDTWPDDGQFKPELVASIWNNKI